MLPGLGWSISDVVLVMSKLLEVYNAFHDGPHNAAKEVQELADELLRFRASLQRLRAVLEHHGQENVDSSDHHDDMSLKEVSVPISEKAPGLQRSPTSSSTLVHYSQKDLDADVKHCLEVIEECAAFIKRYTIITDANAEGKWNKIKRAARVVTWTTEDAVVEGLRRSLKSHLDHIDTSVSLTVASMTLSSVRKIELRNTIKDSEPVVTAVVKELGNVTDSPDLSSRPEQFQGTRAQKRKISQSGCSNLFPGSPGLTAQSRDGLMNGSRGENLLRSDGVQIPSLTSGLNILASTATMNRSYSESSLNNVSTVPGPLSFSMYSPQRSLSRFSAGSDITTFTNDSSMTSLSDYSPRLELSPENQYQESCSSKFQSFKYGGVAREHLLMPSPSPKSLPELVDPLLPEMVTLCNESFSLSPPMLTLPGSILDFSKTGTAPPPELLRRTSIASTTSSTSTSPRLSTASLSAPIPLISLEILQHNQRKRLVPAGTTGLQNAYVQISRMLNQRSGKEVISIQTYSSKGAGRGLIIQHKFPLPEYPVPYTLHSDAGSNLKYQVRFRNSILVIEQNPNSVGSSIRSTGSNVSESSKMGVIKVEQVYYLFPSRKDSHQFQESLLNRKLLLSVGFDRLTYQSSPALGKRILSETENVQLWLAVRRDAEKLETAKVTCMFWSAADHRSLEFEIHILQNTVLSSTSTDLKLSLPSPSFLIPATYTTTSTLDTTHALTPTNESTISIRPPNYPGIARRQTAPGGLSVRGAGLSTGVCISDQLYKQNLGGAIATSMSGKDKGKDKEQRKEMQEKEKKERRKKETDSGCWISLRFSNSQGKLKFEEKSGLKLRM